MSLVVEGLSKSFGGLKAVDDVTFSISEGAIVALIGPNGAGKTTAFAAISGFLKPDRGRVSFQSEDVTGQAPHVMAAKGMVRTFQIVRPFAGQTVLANVAVGAHLRHSRRRDALAKAREVAERVGIGDRLDQDAGDLTVAGRKRLELARALAAEPKLLLLDEVLAGLNPSEIRDILPIIRAIRAGGVTILMIEHVMQAAMSLADHVLVLAHGRLIAEGPPKMVASDARVIEAYLGPGMAKRLAHA